MIATVSSSPSSYALYSSPAGAVQAEAKSADHSKQSETSQRLTDDEQKQVTQLKNRDREVRAHEAAHISAGGAHVQGSASYSYQTGADGKRYAVGGEVSVDTSKVAGDPQKTIEKAMAIRRAALAPAEPSGQDQAVAAQASRMLLEARTELVKSSQTDDEQKVGRAKELDNSPGYRSSPFSQQEQNISEYA